MILRKNVFLLISSIVTTTVSQLTFTAIPDQDNATLLARADAVTNYLENYIKTKCGVSVSVTYNPVSNYQDAVDAILDKTADFGWYGGLTGVQAALRSPPATYLAQRMEDKEFTSVFIQGIGMKFNDISDVQDKSIAFGSESSTSGHLMPAYYLMNNSVTPSSWIFTGSHDATVDAVINGTTEVGALNSVVWNNRVAANTTGGTSVFYTTPEYVDYLWVAGSGIVDTWAGIEGMSENCANINALLITAFLSAKADEPLGKALFDAYSTTGYVGILPGEYNPIEETGCTLGMIEDQYCSQPTFNVGNVIPEGMLNQITTEVVNATVIAVGNEVMNGIFNAIFGAFGAVTSTSGGGETTESPTAAPEESMVKNVIGVVTDTVTSVAETSENIINTVFNQSPTPAP